METTQQRWQHIPALAIPSPVLAIATRGEELWAGGTGGIAHTTNISNISNTVHTTTNRDWYSHLAGLPLTSVSTLEIIEGRIFAGGVEGIAFSLDEGTTWEAAKLTEGLASIMAIVASPRFAQDHTLLAATLETGILRSEDGGVTWKSVNFGLQSLEVNALLWLEGETVLAATSDGLHRSTNSGRAWRFVRNSEEFSFISLIANPDQTLLAASETEGLFLSDDYGATWESYGELSTEAEITGLWRTASATLLVATSNQGLLRSQDDGQTWEEVQMTTVLSLTASQHALFIGTTNGVFISQDDGQTWSVLPHPPVHDLHNLLVADGTIYLSGLHMGMWKFAEGEWKALSDIPYPLTAVLPGPDTSFFISSLQGLQRTTDGGKTWQTVITGEPGNISQMAFRADGRIGCAGSGDGTYLYRTQDGGKSWQPLTAPFGILPLSSLLVTKDSFIAVCYDPRQLNAHVWRSRDNGKNWKHELDGQTNWPLVTTYDQPPLLTMADSLLLQEVPGLWKQVTLGQGGIRRIVGNGTILLALTTQSLLQSHDHGLTWEKASQEISINDILDLALTPQLLYLLLTDGRVLVKEL